MYFIILFFIILIILINRYIKIKNFYRDISEEYKEVASTLKMNFSYSSKNLPIIEGIYENEKVLIELVSSSFLTFPACLRVNLGNHFMEKKGVTITSDYVTGVLSLLAEKDNSEYRKKDEGRIINVKNE